MDVVLSFCYLFYYLVALCCCFILNFIFMLLIAFVSGDFDHFYTDDDFNHQYLTEDKISMFEASTL